MKTQQGRRAFIAGLLVCITIGLIGCEMFDRDGASTLTTPAAVTDLANFIMGEPEITAWGAQYTPGNSYAMINIPVSGALKVEYGMVAGGNFALFADTTQPVELQVGFNTHDGVTDMLEWVCVSYDSGAAFGGRPANAVAHRAHGGAWTHYQRRDNGTLVPWWPTNAAFSFGGTTQQVCVIEQSAVAVTGVAGPFPAPQTPVVVVPSNAAPSASGVNISGTTIVGQTLTGGYTYNDTDGDLEGTSTYQWYRANDNSGTGSAAIGGATSTTYTLQAADTGKYLQFEVIPVASSGTSPGSAAQSAWTEPVTVEAVVMYSAGKHTGNLGGRTGADALCAAAKPGGLHAGYTNFKAFISIDVGDAIADLLFPASLPITGPTGTLIDNNRADLLDENILVHLETAGVLPTGGGTFFWSGSDANGNYDAGTTNNCQNFTSASNTDTGRAGDANPLVIPLPPGWYLGVTNAGCNNTDLSLLCVAY